VKLLVTIQTLVRWVFILSAAFTAVAYLYTDRAALALWPALAAYWATQVKEPRHDQAPTP
jgi:hypothetical protein